MRGITIYEYDTLATAGTPCACRAVPPQVFAWLEQQCFSLAENGGAPWLKVTQRHGHRAVQVTSYVGVVRAPNGYQIEVLPKIGKAFIAGDGKVRELLIEMLRCLVGFRHIKTDSADLAARRMPLLEVYIGEFLLAVEQLVKRGLRNDYVTENGNLFALRGKLLISKQVRDNLHRADRFFAAYDVFTPDRPENRLLHTALRIALSMSTSQANQRLARELRFVFADVPESTQINLDFQRCRIDRGMGYYRNALAWAKLILEEESPLTGVGKHHAPSLLFPMESVFEAFVAKHLASQLASPLSLKKQPKTSYLVAHQNQTWFQLNPDLLIRNGDRNVMVLDTKWKLLNQYMNNAREKYQLSQADFYQLYTYGQHYLDGQGDVVLIYPKTDEFSEPLPDFTFPQAPNLRMWVLPFCLQTRRLILPRVGTIREVLRQDDHANGASERKPAAA